MPTKQNKTKKDHVTMKFVVPKTQGFKTAKMGHNEVRMPISKAISYTHL
jgi:hypothetical protein